MKDRFVETSIKKIKEASNNNKLVIFVGAGVSANSGIPTWTELINELARELGEFKIENSSDMYLKIAQYYFNERGEKEYFEKLNEVFLTKKYKPNPIHNEIFKLKPTHIITTNYDTLLEEAALENGQFYHVVRQELDLPYNNLNKTILKMHGDFENGNIVLKEDDYLNYSSNFSLIENYLKSLIATNTVLFIGYSVSDPNFNLIFQWVKNILKNHFQPAYLIEASNSYSRMEYEYYKNRGINILYYDGISSEIELNNIFEIENWRGNKLFDTLSYFNGFNKVNDLTGVEEIYSKLSCFENLNFVMPEQVVKNLKLKSVGYDLYGDRNICVLEDKNVLLDVFSNAEAYKDHKLFLKICNLLKKANIYGVSSGENLVYQLDGGNEYILSLQKSIIDNDSLIGGKELGLRENNYFSMLKQAYRDYENERYYDAYKYYKTISRNAFNDKEYLIYYISEFNRKHVGFFMSNSFNKIDDEVIKDIEQINLEEIYNNLPFKERKSLEFIKELQDFNLIYKIQNKLRKEVKTLQKTKRTIEKGGIAFNSSLQKNFNIISDIWMFIKSNYLCLDKYLEVEALYHDFIEGVFASYSTQTKNNSEGFLSDVAINKVEQLDIFSVYVIITKLKTKDFENLLYDYDIKNISLNNEAVEYIIKVVDKFVPDFYKEEIKDKKEHNLFNLLVLLSKVDLEKNVANQIALKLLGLICKNTYLNEMKYLNIYIVSIANKDLINQDVVIKFLERYLEVAYNNPGILEYDTNNLYENLARIYNKYDKNEFLLRDSVLFPHFEYIDMETINQKYNEVYRTLIDLLLPIHTAMSNDRKSKLNKLIISLINDIENKETEINYYELNFYFKSALNGLVSSNKNINRLILEDTKKKKISYENSNFRPYPDSVKTNLSIIVDLYRKDFISKEEIKSYIPLFRGISDYFDCIFYDEDVELKKLDYIYYLNQNEIDRLMENEEFRAEVHKLFDKKFEQQLNKKEYDIFKKVYKDKL
ncbi:SIR2 family protein [Bacillus mycoides]|uniref:SIR2 family protein n=1 Tax=Bacillus mycoides TaxID=1405 RepID=UPI001C025684|nr:SIR2 family protein [Bacillus mycoides]QWH54351.1 SIR2 family protein [Bacillus mycoides]QWJ03942.1 SIR2 family protein [Bacillus mycoides]